MTDHVYNTYDVIIAAHSPAGPAPTMITSYVLFTWSVIRHPFSLTRAELEPRRIGVRRERPRELLLESYRLELDIRPLRAGQLRERRPSDDLDAMSIAAALVQQRCRGLDQPLPHLRRARGLHDLVTLEHRIDGERADAEHVVAAHEQRRAVYRLALRAQPLREPAHRVAHLPGARTADRRADGGLDAVRRAEPVRKGDVAGVVGRGGAAVVRRAKRSRDGCHGDRALGPALARPRQDPLKHEVRHQRRGDDIVLRLARPRPGGAAEERSEVGIPRRDRKRPVGRLSELRPRAAGGVAVHNDHPPESGLPLVLRLGELTGVERAVAAAPDDDHVPHHDDVAHRINRPPSTTSVVPVT